MKIVKFEKTGIEEIDSFFDRMMEKVRFLGCGRNSKRLEEILEEKGIENRRTEWDVEYTTRMIDSIPDRIDPELGKELVWGIAERRYWYELDSESVSTVEILDGDGYAVYKFAGRVEPDRYRLARRMLDMYSLVRDRENEIRSLYDLFIMMEREEARIRRRKNGLAQIVFGMAKV